MPPPKYSPGQVEDFLIVTSDSLVKKLDHPAQI